LNVFCPSTSETAGSVLESRFAFALGSQQMDRRESLTISATILAALVSASCAKRKRVSAVRAPATPRTTPAEIVSPEMGLASWYGHPYHGRAAANGEIYDMEKLTAAHRTLPFGTWVRVTSIANSKQVDVRIIDRGPFVDGRIIDLSHAAARAVDLIGAGVGQVRIEVLSVPPAAMSNALFAVQVGAFEDKSRAERLRDRMQREYGIAEIALRNGNPPLWRVLAGKERSESSAAALAERIKTAVGPVFLVRVD
jgi:rare lipoprotein A